MKSHTTETTVRTVEYYAGEWCSVSLVKAADAHILRVGDQAIVLSDATLAALHELLHGEALSRPAKECWRCHGDGVVLAFDGCAMPCQDCRK